MFAFARDHNIYVVNVASKDTVQLSKDGAKDYSFGARDTTAAASCQVQQTGGGQDDDQQQYQERGQ